MERTPLALPPSLPRRGAEHVVLTLGDAEVRAKRAALARYESQQREMGPFLAAFVRQTEPFSVFAPDELEHIDRTITRHLTRH